MKRITDAFGLLADPSRLRILMLLDRKELCVCQIMGVLGISQPLVSRNLSLLSRAGFLEGRREGKMIFYRLKDALPAPLASIMALLKETLARDETFRSDLRSLGDCAEYQKKTGKCDMKTYLEFMERKKRSRKR